MVYNNNRNVFSVSRAKYGTDITASMDYINQSSLQNSYLWKVDTQPPLYLFGTMHVPYTKLWDFIPENVKTAFSSCDEVCLELRLSDDETRQELYNCQLLPGGVESVEEVLSKDMVQRIEQYLESIRKLFSKWLPQSGSPLLGGVDRYICILNVM